MYVASAPQRRLHQVVSPVRVAAGGVRQPPQPRHRRRRELAELLLQVCPHRAPPLSTTDNAVTGHGGWVRREKFSHEVLT